VNPYPVQTPVGSGRVAGDGKPGQAWNFGGVHILFMNYMLANWLTTDGVIVNSKEVTIYTPVFDITSGLYKRYNAYLIKPIPDEDYRYTRLHTVDLIMRFSKLVEI
jgi:hypothetical protein